MKTKQIRSKRSRLGFGSNQKYALIIFVFSAAYTVAGLTQPKAMHFDPVGPYLWLVGVGIIMQALAIALFFSAEKYLGKFPNIQELIEKLPFVLSIILYSYILPVVGFFIATTILIIIIGINFNAKPVAATIAAILMTIGCYLVFDVGLDISLPLGSIFR